MSVAGWAARYMELGLACFPLVEGGKVPPRGSRGHHGATTDPARIAEWWPNGSRLNLGVAVPAGHLVVDVDPGGGPALAALDLTLPTTATQRTPRGGAHYVYSLPDGVKGRQTAGVVAPGVDTRSHPEGYIVAQPSRRSDGEYVWEIPPVIANIAPAPSWLVDWCREAPRAEVAEAGEAGDEAIPTGRRNDSLARVAGRLRRDGLEPEEIAAALLAVNARRCSPPLSEREVRAIAGSIGRYEAEDPVLADDGPHLAPIPDYPTGALTGPLRDLVEAGEAAGLPAAFVAGGGLAALAYCARDCRVEVGPGWVERPGVWVAIVGAPGSGKSPAWQFGFPPVWAAEESLRTVDRIRMENWRATPKDARGAPPDPSTHVISDATVEALIRRLAAAGPQLVATDELRSWLGGLGRYGAGNATQREIGLYLSMWDAVAPVCYDRVGGQVSLVAERPLVAIVGTLQTEDHRLLGGVGSGLRPRWLPHLAAEPVRRGTGQGAPAEWTEPLSELAGSPPARVYRLRGMRREWDAVCERWAAEAPEASPGLRGALDKAPRQALRVAACLAVGRGEAFLSPDSLRGAVAIVDYALGCWRALPEGDAFSTSRTGERLDEAVDRLAAWLERRCEGRATRHEVLKAQVAGIRTAAALDAILEHYEAVYPNSVQPGESGPRGGRRGTVVLAPRRGVAPGSSAARRNWTSGGNHESPAATGHPAERPAELNHPAELLNPAELDHPAERPAELDRGYQPAFRRKDEPGLDLGDPIEQEEW